jgi:hypothetical protein
MQLTWSDKEIPQLQMNAIEGVHERGIRCGTEVSLGTMVQNLRRHRRKSTVAHRARLRSNSADVLTVQSSLMIQSSNLPTKHVMVVVDV